MEQNKINRFLENDLNKRLPFAWYLLGSMIVIIFSFVGQFPMLFFTSAGKLSATGQLGLVKVISTSTL